MFPGPVHIMFMSGVEDGRLITVAPDDALTPPPGGFWTIRFGRRQDNEVWLRFDSFASRLHALLIWRDGRWWLEDGDSKNGTYVDDALDEARVSGAVPLADGQLFRVGRTWFRVESDSAS